MASAATIYVQLLDEGVEVWRPVHAIHLSGNSYRISPDLVIPPDESWPFSPGDVVECELRRFADGNSGLVAIRRL